MTQTVFGPGVLYATRNDVTNATPINIGYANEFTLDFNANMKDLYGQNQYPLDVARGTVKPTAKAKAAVLSGIAMNNIFFGETFSTGGIIWNLSEAHAVPTTPYQVTVTNSATFDQDLGVVYGTGATNPGQPLIKVASGPTVGQYSVNTGTGVYTFAAADTTVNMNITYTSTVATGQNFTINNKLLGYNPTFQLDYYTSRTFSGTTKPFVVRLFSCVSGSISLPFKLEDFTMPEFDIELLANSASQVGKMYFPEVN